MGLDASELAGMRLTVNEFLPDRATNGRTGVTVDCLLEDLGRMQRFAGMPSYWRLPLYALTEPDGTDLKAGDDLDITDKGGYVALAVPRPSYSTGTNAEVVRLTDASGTLATMTSQTATFHQAGALDSTGDITLKVLIFEAYHRTQIDPDAVRFQWCVYFPDSTRFSATRYVSENDVILTPLATGGKANLQKPIQDSLLPFKWAYFESTT